MPRLALPTLDRAIVMTVLMRLWGVGAGLVMVVITSTLFSPAKQGYYYTFNSLIALQAFFELGLNFVLIQFVSHDAVHLADGVDPGERQLALDRIGLLFRSVRRWFAVSGLLFAILVGVGGLFFLKRSDEVPAAEWVGAWFLMVAAAAINLYYSPQVAIAEGMGKVAAVAKLRTLQSMAGYLVCWAIMAVHPTLFAVACIGASTALSNGWWIRRHSGVIAVSDAVSPEARGHGWRRDILPLQWRIGLSWMSGYLLYQVLTPLTFAHRGAVEAARIGLSISIFSNISLIAISWFSATTPMLAGFVARGERGELRARFATLFLQSIAFQLAASIGLCCVVAIGLEFDIAIMRRFLPLPQLAILALVALCNSIIFALATFMRVHKKEPMLANSLVCGALVAGVAWFTSFHGSAQVVTGNLAVIALVSLPWTIALFLRFWRLDDAG